MPTTESLISKIESNFKSLPTVGDQKRALENLKIIWETRIADENKALQETIDANLKLKA